MTEVYGVIVEHVNGRQLHPGNGDEGGPVVMMPPLHLLTLTGLVAQVDGRQLGQRQGVCPQHQLVALVVRAQSVTRCLHQLVRHYLHHRFVGFAFGNKCN